MPDSFSQRHNLAGPPSGTLLRDEVPPSFRMFLLRLCLQEKHFEIHELQQVTCHVLQVWPKSYPSPYYECEKLIKECEWFRIYDIIERLYKLVYERTSNRGYTGIASALGKEINKAFVDQNIGWQINDNGKIVTRGDAAFEGTINTAVAVLQENKKPTTVGHLQAAISALSTRPKPNTSGAVSHATNAVECVLGEVTGSAMTLGKYLDKYPYLFHPALKKGLDGVYGYASDEGARHGKEGTEPKLEEAEFVVAVCAATCTLLTRKHARGNP